MKILVERRKLAYSLASVLQKISSAMGRTKLSAHPVALPINNI